MYRSAAGALGLFIETFEQHPTAESNPSWQQVRLYVDPVVHVPHVGADPSDVVLRTRTRQFPGVVLFASDSLVLLQPAREAYDWRASQALAVPTREIEGVLPRSTGAQRRALRAGAIGGAAGLGAAAILDGVTGETSDEPSALTTLTVGLSLGYTLTRLFWPQPQAAGSYAERRGYLEERARFAEGAPYAWVPETAERPDREGFPSKPYSPPGSLGRTLRAWNRAYGWVSVGVLNSGSVTDRAPAAVYEEFFANRTPDQTVTRTGLRSISGISSGLDASIRPVPWVRLGGQWVRRTELVLEDPLARESAFTIPGESLKPYVEVILPSPRYRGLAADLALGIGWETNRLVASRSTSGTGRPLEYRLEEEGANRFTQATAEVFTSRHTSLFVRYTRRDLPTIAVEGFEERFPIDPEVVQYSVSPHEVEFGYSEVTWGTRFHL